MAQDSGSDVDWRARRVNLLSTTEAAATHEQERVLLVAPEAPVLAATDVGLDGKRVRDGVAYAGITV